MSPAGATLLHSPGRKPWVNHLTHLLSPVGAAQPQCKVNTRSASAAPTELLIFVSPVYPGFHIGLCPHYTPWALKKHRAYGTHNAPEFGCACPV